MPLTGSTFAAIAVQIGSRCFHEPGSPPGISDGPGASARFRYPTGLTLDASGNLYVADQANSTIRKLVLNGTNWIVSTIAGTATKAGSADDTNTVARFNNPKGIAADSLGNLYVADTGNATIRRIHPSGTNWIVTTIAGLAHNAGTADGAGSAARFVSPESIAICNNADIYVTDSGSHTIRTLIPAGANWIADTTAGYAGITGTADGSGSAARFNTPYGVFVDSKTNVFLTDSLNHTVRGATPTVATVAISVHAARAQEAQTLALAWNAVTGQKYRLQYKTNFTQPNWIDLGEVTASNWPGPASVPIATDPQRFYRVIPAP